MTAIQLFVMILTIHFLADFGLQTHEQATRKGEGRSFWNRWLAYHVGVYTLVWGAVFFFLPLPSEFQSIIGWITFCLLIGIPHYLTDWVTSRLSKPFFNSGDFHNGFVVVGADQVIHYLCLIWVILNLIKPL